MQAELPPTGHHREQQSYFHSTATALNFLLRSMPTSQKNVQKHMERACCLCQTSSDNHEWGMRNVTGRSARRSRLHLEGFENKDGDQSQEASRSTYLDIGLRHIGRLMKLVSGSLRAKPRMKELTSPLTMILLETAGAALGAG